MKRFLFNMFVLMATFVVLLTTIRVVGSSNKSPFMIFMEQTYCYPQPCWHGIHVGETHSDEAKQILSADSHFVVKAPRFADSGDFCWNVDSVGSGCVAENYLGIQSNADFRLGNAILLFGYPTSGFSCGKWDNYPGIIIVVHFPGNIAMRAHTLEPRQIAIFDPNAVIDRIWYYPSLEPFDNTKFNLFAPVGPDISCGETPME
jgi:hypothetical protein